MKLFCCWNIFVSIYQRLCTLGSRQPSWILSTEVSTFKLHVVNVSRIQLTLSTYSGTCLILHAKGPGKCVRLYRILEYSGFILVNRNTLGPSFFVRFHRMSENSGVGLHCNNYSCMPIIVTMAQKWGPDDEKSEIECLAFLVLYYMNKACVKILWHYLKYFSRYFPFFLY